MATRGQVTRLAEQLFRDLVLYKTGSDSIEDILQKDNTALEEALALKAHKESESFYRVNWKYKIGRKEPRKNREKKRIYVRPKPPSEVTHD